MKGLLNMTLSSENGAIGTSGGAEAVQWPSFQAFLFTAVDLTWACVPPTHPLYRDATAGPRSLLEEHSSLANWFP